MHHKSLRTVLSLLFVILLCVLVIVGFYINFSIIWWNTRIHFHHFAYSLIYIVAWISFLIFALRIRSNVLYKIYWLFWLLGSIHACFFFMMLLPEMMGVFGILVMLGFPVFIMPIGGLRFLFGITEILLPIISIIMFAIGVVASRNHCKTKGIEIDVKQKQV